MAEILEIWGGRPLYGTVEIPSAKNSVLPLLAASVLCREKVCLKKVPHLSDVEVCLALMRSLGMDVRYGDTGVVIQPTANMEDASLQTELMQKMRASVLFLAPVLARCGYVEASLPGGCRLGKRPIDIHLDGLEHMGANVRWHGERLCLRAPRGLMGTKYTLRYPSVGATETLLLASVCAKGDTVLHGAACEPEIVDLANFLNQCGGKITGAGTETISVQGVSRLSGGAYTPIPDRIVGATWACAAAAAGGCVTLEGAQPEMFAPVLDALEQAGCRIWRRKNQVKIERRKELVGIGERKTAVYPGFPTDAAPLLAAALLGASGESCIRDTIFTNRFACADGFLAMGANVHRIGSDLRILPGGPLHGTTVAAQDLRGGAALVIAALAANGKTKIEDSFYIQRGYADLPQQLRRLGVKIQVKKT